VKKYRKTLDGRRCNGRLQRQKEGGGNRRKILDSEIIGAIEIRINIINGT